MSARRYKSRVVECVVNSMQRHIARRPSLKAQEAKVGQRRRSVKRNEDSIGKIGSVYFFFRKKPTHYHDSLLYS